MSEHPERQVAIRRADVKTEQNDGITYVTVERSYEPGL